MLNTKTSLLISTALNTLTTFTTFTALTALTSATYFLRLPSRSCNAPLFLQLTFCKALLTCNEPRPLPAPALTTATNLTLTLVKACRSAGFGTYSARKYHRTPAAGRRCAVGIATGAATGAMFANRARRNRGAAEAVDTCAIDGHGASSTHMANSPIKLETLPGALRVAAD